MRSLVTPFRRFQQEVRALRDTFVAHTPGSLNAGFWEAPADWSVQCYVMVRLLDEWGLFSRSVVIASAWGRVTSRTGTAVPRSPVLSVGQDPLDALRNSFTKPKPATWEPRWYNPIDAIDAANRLQIHNLGNVAAGLGLAGTTPEDLRHCRNYVAHRSRRAESDAGVVRTRFTPARTEKIDSLASIPMPDGRLLLEHWCDDLITRAQSAVT